MKFDFNPLHLTHTGTEYSTPCYLPIEVLSKVYHLTALQIQCTVIVYSSCRVLLYNWQLYIYVLRCQAVGNQTVYICSVDLSYTVTV